MILCGKKGFALHPCLSLYVHCMLSQCACTVLVCVRAHVHTICFHHTRDTCTLPRSIPLSVTPVHGPPFQHAVSNPKQMISGKYRAKVGGMEGGIRWADKKKGRKKESRALSPWPSIRSLEKKKREGEEEKKVYGQIHLPLCYNQSLAKRNTQ